MRVIIVDDEPLARRGLRQLLRPHGDVEIVGEARDGREAVRLLKRTQADLLFLDVQMPEMDGFAVLRELRGCALPSIIFVTAYDAFAVKAFETHALDYLVKPVHEQRFDAALERARERLQTDEAIALSRRLSELLMSQADPATTDRAEAARRLIIPDAGGEVMIDVNEVSWVEADDYYSAVHARGRRYLLRESLESIEQRLDPGRFVRVHRSAIVNLARVREVRKEIGSGAVVLSDGTRVPLSRRRREAVADALRAFAKHHPPARD